MYVCSTLFMAWKIMGNHSYYHAEAIYHFSKKILEGLFGPHHLASAEKSSIAMMTFLVAK